MSVMNAFVGAVPKGLNRITDAKATASGGGAVKAYVGLKPATLFNKPETSSFAVSNGCKTECSMGVWSPINNRFFETLSFLPPLSDAEVAKQINYITGQDWTPCVEFAVPENALTDNHGTSGIVSSASCGYYDNRYWTMWKLPMFGCTDSNQVLAEISACVRAFPTAYIRVCGFDPIKQVQVTSMLVHRPPSEPAIPVNQRSVTDTTTPYVAPTPSSFTFEPPATSPPAPAETDLSMVAQPLSYFALDKLTPKGPRVRVDHGDPHDFTRKLTGVGNASAGSWACTEGGWDSPNKRDSTETFYVLSGQGCVTDPDGTPHPFGPGDAVVLPKGWYGRWDISQLIHKVWMVHAHDDVAGMSTTPVVVPLAGMGQTTTLYAAGPTRTGCIVPQPGRRVVTNQPATEAFHILEGSVVLTGADGAARQCSPGDMVVLPKGWSGSWDIAGPAKLLMAEASD
eukprot:CAMPEP_0118929798 /NCGR_PEP_ID=MMETSP1169-20130426/6693_1 /TAXON_ID=36882 /ORGANISM="Pyramimonas obovata, Strain CCMP722" /LENGTH=453 /DNA_ID=CAMNT_0006872053 /DNA_START=15 /DNA_END=1376 /DNA_ORIENTATION=-